MMKKRIGPVRNRGKWLLFFLLFFIFPVGQGYTGKTAFGKEHLRYQVYIRGIPVGEQSLQLVGETVYEGFPVYHIQITLRSYAAFSLFFRYREEGILYLDKEGFFPRYSCRVIEEQRKTTKEENLFFPEKGEIISRITRNGGTTEFVYSSPEEPCQENLSLVYYLRTRPWEKGKNAFYFLTRSGPVKIDYHHLGSEEVTTPYKKLAADKVDDPVSRITVWISRDQQAYPVKIRAVEDFGTIDSLLVGVDGR